MSSICNSVVLVKNIETVIYMPKTEAR